MSAPARQRYLRSDRHAAGARIFAGSDAAALVLCFPPAGGNAGYFRPLATALGPEFTLAAFDPPGHGLWSGPPLLDVPSLVAVVRELFPEAGPNTILVGASLGGYVAHQLAIALEAEGRGPHGVLILGTPPYRNRAACRSLRGLRGEALIAALAPLGGLPPELRAAPELLERFLRTMDADFLAFESALEPPSRLFAPLEVLVGDADEFAPPRLFGAWNEVGEQVRVEEVPGPHLLLPGSVEYVAAAVRRLALNPRR